MILADKIIMLRKKCGWSQEELAEKLNVSRQSVSKWEGAQSVPDLDKILQLSKIFGVTTDYLLKDSIEEVEEEKYSEDIERDVKVRWVSMAEANSFLEVKEQTADKIANAVSLCILSPVVMFILLTLAESRIISISEELAGGAGMATLLVMVTAAVAIFVTCGMRTGQYEYLEKEEIETEYGVEGMAAERKRRYVDTHIRYSVIGTCLCVLSAIPLLVIAFLTNDDVFVMFGLCGTLELVAVGVNLLVRSGIRWASYQKLLQEGEYTVAAKEKERIAEPMAVAYWLIITAIYLAYSFTTMQWHRSWIIWPVAAVLYGAVYAVYTHIKMK